MIFSNSKTYKIMKYVSSILIPALGVFYGTIAVICHLPYGEEVGGISLALTTLLNTLMGVSSERYHKINDVESVDEEVL